MKNLIKDAEFWMIICSTAAIVSLNIITFSQRSQIYTLKTSNKQLRADIDSLKQECLSKELSIGRYEYTIDCLEDMNPQAAKAFNDVLSDTE